MNWYKTLKLSDLVLEPPAGSTYYSFGHGQRPGEQLYVWILKDNNFQIAKSQGQETHGRLFGKIEPPKAKGRLVISPNGDVKSSMLIYANNLMAENTMERQVEKELRNRFGDGVVINNYTYS